MTIKAYTGGSISLKNDIQTEFGGPTTNISLLSYRAGAGHVLAGTIGYPKPSGTATAISSTVGDMNAYYGSSSYVAPVVTATLTSSTPFVFESDTVTFTLSTTNVPNGTNVTWYLFPPGSPAGPQYADIPADFDTSVYPISGTVTVNSNTASFTVQPLNDGLVESGLQLFRAGAIGTGINLGSNDVSIVDIPIITQDTTSVNEGSSVTFTVSSYVTDGTVLNWTTSAGPGLNAADFTDGVLTGTVTITANTGTIVRTLVNDLSTEGPETFYIVIGTSTTPLLSYSGLITVNDTSTAPVIVAPETLYQFFTSQSWTVPSGVTSLTFLTIGGGGGGGSTIDGVYWPEAGGGGGAGGAIYQPYVTSVSSGEVVEMTIGAGGAGGAGGQGANGGNTLVSIRPYAGFVGPVTTLFTAYGGGYGGTYANGQPYETQQFGGNGGSGGGANSAWAGDHAGGNVAGTGTVGQGHAGSVGARGSWSGSGGGYLSAASNFAGGAGSTITLATTAVTFGGGGGGGGAAGQTATQGGGAGGGPDVAGTSGTAFTGGGGGGGGQQTIAGVVAPGGAGGSGAVYILVNKPALVGGPVSTFSSSLSTIRSTPGVAHAGFTMNPTGTITAINSGATASNTMGTGWFVPTTADVGFSYWAYFTSVGSLSNGAAYLNTWTQLSSALTLDVSVTAGASQGTNSSSAVVTVTISTSAGGPTVASGTMTLYAEASGFA
jgi:hypothetical protein